MLQVIAKKKPEKGFLKGSLTIAYYQLSTDKNKLDTNLWAQTSMT